MIYLNARHSSEKNRDTYEHELTHIQRDDFNNTLSIEAVESKQTPVANQSRAIAFEQLCEALPLSNNIKQDAQRLFGLPADDKRWDAIIFAMLITGSVTPGREYRETEWTYVFFPVKVKKGMMSKATRDIGYVAKLKQKRALHPFNKNL